MGWLGRARWATLGLALLTGTAVAHDFRAGALRLDHPYATPSDGDQGQLCLRQIRNVGAEADRLLSVNVPSVGTVLPPEGQAFPLTLPAGSNLAWRHDNKACLRLRGLERPLQAGDRFDAVLRFERAGEARVQVWVQQPRTQTR